MTGSEELNDAVAELIRASRSESPLAETATTAARSALLSIYTRQREEIEDWHRAAMASWKDYVAALAHLERLKAEYSVCPNCDTSWTNSEVDGEWARLKADTERLDWLIREGVVASRTVIDAALDPARLRSLSDTPK